MPRPTDADAAFIAACDAEIARFHQEARRGKVPSIPLRFFKSAKFREVWYCGAWLWRKLLMLGMDDRTARAICNAKGPVFLRAMDPWQAAAEALAAAQAEPR